MRFARIVFSLDILRVFKQIYKYCIELIPPAPFS